MDERMDPAWRKPKADLSTRVVQAAEAALADHGYVSAIDLLSGIGWLTPGTVDSWRQGRVDSLQEAIQANPDKISDAMSRFRQWANEKQLKASETRYVRSTRNGTVDLQPPSSFL
jgi:hypothetical protein